MSFTLLWIAGKKLWEFEFLFSSNMSFNLISKCLCHVITDLGLFNQWPVGIGLRQRGQENPNIHILLPHLHNNPSTFLKSLGLCRIHLIIKLICWSTHSLQSLELPKYFYLIYVPKVSVYLCNYSKSCLSLAECNDMDGCSLGENDMSDMTENKYQYN